MSYRELAHRSRRAFAASTLCKALKGRNLPPGPLVENCIWACSGSKEDVQVWMTAWRCLRMKHCSASRDVLAPVTPIVVKRTG
ncbi:hypothetical protein GT755_29490 [Herbidospora sp. NEAU-GS84]|uniref:Uncharacterized protein n=1 Tax=Herbidospora solisilvae TaxID=2696284 RepID=A0A7C9JIK8_9ACTN|nr:hypothetical protein [Herbidospora solisilvae]NAS25803.1 hypothetical protein [Herbidospora solisilvae]